MGKTIVSFSTPLPGRQVAPTSRAPGAMTGLAALCAARYREAALWRKKQGSGPGDRAAEDLMTESRRLFHGILSPAQAALSADVANVKINLVDEKVTVARAWLLDVVMNNLDEILTVSPTPVPELSKAGTDEVKKQIKQALVDRLRVAGYPADDASLSVMPREVRTDIALWLADTAKSLKGAATIKQSEIAASASRDMERLIHDQLIEAGFRQEFTAFVDDFTQAPFAVLKAPTVEMAMAAKWSGNAWGMTPRKRVGVRRVNPWNFYWAPDAVSAQTGGYVVEVIPTRRDQLVAMAKLPNWDAQALLAALEEYSSRSPLDWLQRNPDAQASKALGWASHQSIDRVVVHGIFSGRELAGHGLGLGVGGLEFVEAVVTTIGSHVVQARMATVPMGGARPYHVTSFRPSTEHLCGRGLPNLLADVQIAAYAAFWALLRNAAYAAGARGEVDIGRIKSQIPEGATPESVLQQQFHFVEADMARTQGGAGAFRFHVVPQHMAAYQSLIDDLGRRADRACGIPSIASGGLDFATAGRSHAGMSQLLGSATKTIKVLLANIDHDVFGPMGEALYRHNLQQDTEKRFINLDAEVKARGTAGLLERELRKQAAVEALQAAPALVALAREGGAALPPGLITEIVGAAARGMGIDTSAYPEMAAGGGSAKAIDQAAVGRFGATPPVVTPAGPAPAT